MSQYEYHGDVKMRELEEEVARLRGMLEDAPELEPIPMLQFIAETRLKKYAELEMLVAQAVLHHGITDPADLVVCEATEGGVHRLWVEPQSSRHKDDRATMLREEVAHWEASHRLVCAELAEREAEVARLRSLRDHLLERGEAVARLHAGRLEAKDAEIARLRGQIDRVWDVYYAEFGNRRMSARFTALIEALGKGEG